MAGNKINTKKKEEKNKVNRINNQAIDENEETDFSLLRKPISTNITGFAQARKIFDQATEELKSLLTNECDLLYECKVCRNIFRSLANFISHKRVYCKENFNTSIHGHFFKETSFIQEMLKIRKLEEGYQESLKEINGSNGMEDDDIDERIPLSKDITEVVERITKHKGVQEQQLQEQQLVFQKIPKSSVAVYQNIVIADDDTSSDSMQVQVKELDNILSQENAILESDGTFKVQGKKNNSTNIDHVIQISDDEENGDTDILKCRICDVQFSTQKTLKFHMKYKHLESRLVYPCPDCLDIFSTSWSVYRHLFKVHRKTAAQIRRLRESIQAKAFRMNNPPAFYEKRKTIPKIVPSQKITEEERLDQENQAWLEQLDGESDGRRCGGCGRNFERRAALAAHAHTCARRHRRRIQIQIRKDYHKAQHNPYLHSPRAAPVTDTVTVVEDTPTEEKVVEKDSKNEDDGQQLTEAVMTIIDDKNEQDEVDKEMEIDNTIALSKPYFYDSILMNKLPFAQQAEKSNLTAFKQKMQADTEIDQLLCKKCDSKFDELNKLLEHMGAHYKWMRYACKLCNFKHFNFENVPEHVKIVHKLKGDTDFYYSTVKAIDGTEASELSETTDEVSDTNEISPDSRRPSRCSSDSSRLSDDSSSSSTRIEAGSRKRKANRHKNISKKKKETVITDDGDDNKEDESQKDVLIIENDSSSNSKIFEENSSDFDDIEEKTKRQVELPTTVTSRRPIRKKTKRKNEDFEYDLSNLLKMEAQGYRDSQTVSNKPTPSKKKSQDIQNHYDLINKDCCGALITLSRKSVEKSQCHMKILALFNASKETRISSVFARPMTPKTARTDKISPKKDEKELKDISSLNKVIESSSSLLDKVVTDNKVTNIDSENKECKISEPEVNKECKISETEVNNECKISEPELSKECKISKPEVNKEYKISEAELNMECKISEPEVNKECKISEQEVVSKKCKISEQEVISKKCKISESDVSEDCKRPEPEVSKDSQAKSIKDVIDVTCLSTNDKILIDSNKEVKEKVRLDTIKLTGTPSTDTTKPNLNVPLVPIKLRRQSLELIKNPLIKKNITDFTKSGMKTKILVIKPLSRSTDGTQALNTPLKFQTIKLKDSNKNSALNEEKKDQVVVVQVPKVDCSISRPMSKNSVVENVKSSAMEEIKSPISEEDKIVIDSTSSDNDEAIPDSIENTPIQLDCDSITNSLVNKTNETSTNLDKTS